MSRRALAIFLALGFAWGIPYLLIKVAVEELDPAQLVLARTALATLLLLPVAFARGAIKPLVPHWKALVAYSLIEIAVPWVTLSRAEQSLPSSITGLLIAAVPIVGLGVAFVSGRAERLPATGWIGLGLGLAGVGALVGLDIGGSHLGPLLDLAVTVVGYAIGPAILSRALSELPAIGVVASSLALTALIYVPIVLASSGVPRGLPAPKVIWAVVILAVVCTAAAFLLLFALVAEVGPVRATTITYINPAVAVVAGAVILGEDITVWTVVGFVLVVAGSYFVNKRPARNSAQLTRR